MKKENKKMAQARRAAERKKQKRNRMIKKILVYALPCFAILAIVLLLAFQNDTSVDVSYQTDTSLTIKDGDKVRIDYVGSVDGVEFEGGSTDGKGTDLVIGSGTYIDDFEEQLIGHHPGENVDVNVTFPEDYGKEDLNGKDALFQVTIHGIYQE